MRTLIALPVFLAACTIPGGPGAGVEGAADVLPTEEQLHINFPVSEEASAKDVSVEAEASAEVRTEWARYYVVTRETTEHVNGLITWVLGTVAYVTSLPPEQAEANVSLWGPYSDSGLDPVETGLWVRAEDDGSYTWALFQVPNGGDLESDAVTIVAGVVDAGSTRVDASGTFTADFTTAASLDPAVELTGTFTVEYAYDADGVAASAGFDDYGLADGGDRIDALYAYDEDYAGAGSMDLAWMADVNGTSVEELHVMRSRWQADGQGRADAAIGEGDLNIDGVTASECWGTDFTASYWVDSILYYEQVGDGSACAFADVEYPTEASFSVLD